MKFLLVLAAALVSSAAMAQDYGLTVGIHQTTAKVDTTQSGTSLAGATASVDGKLGFDAGLTASFELVPNLRFRTGVLYDQRPFDVKVNGFGTATYNFAYIDVPVNVQYNITPMFGVYGGLIVGIKASDSVSAPSGGTIDPKAKSMIPLLNVGGNFMFNDMIGFDVFYEMGLGDVADNIKDYSTFGMHFIYWL